MFVCTTGVVLICGMLTGPAAVVLAVVRTREEGPCHLAGPRRSAAGRPQCAAQDRATDEADLIARAGKYVGKTYIFILLLTPNSITALL